MWCEVFFFLLLFLLVSSHRKGKFQTVEVVVGARIPILKLRFLPRGLDVDVCLNNRAAVINTRLLGQVSCGVLLYSHAVAFFFCVCVGLCCCVL